MKFSTPSAYFVLGLLLVPAVFSRAAEKDSEKQVQALLARSLEKTASLDAYTCVFEKQERVDGQWQKNETIFLKFSKPFKVYLRWLQEFQGQELLYVEGSNQNRLTGHTSGLFSWYIADIATNSSMAMHGNRYPVTAVGLANLSHLAAKNLDLARKQGRPELKLEKRQSAGQPEQVAEINFHFRDPAGTDADLCRFWFDEKLGFINKVEIERPAGTLVGRYYYSQIQTNIKLTDEDFSRNNPNYHF